MKRLALVAAVFALAACSAKEEVPPVDTATPAMTPAPAPAPMDTGMKMDSTMKMDSMKTDTMTKRP